MICNNAEPITTKMKNPVSLRERSGMSVTSSEHAKKKAHLSISFNTHQAEQGQLASHWIFSVESTSSESATQTQIKISLNDHHHLVIHHTALGNVGVKLL